MGKKQSKIMGIRHNKEEKNSSFQIIIRYAKKLRKCFYKSTSKKHPRENLKF